MSGAARDAARWFLRRLPPAQRSRVAALRGLAARAESSARRRLPPWAGGRLPSGALQVRLLAANDAGLVARLRGSDAAVAPIAAAGAVPLGLFLGDRLVAFGTLLDRAAPGAPPFHRALIAALFVDPRMRRRGLGVALVAACLGELTRLGTVEAYAGVDADNGASQRAMRRAGFELAPPETPRPSGVRPQQLLFHIHVPAP